MSLEGLTQAQKDALAQGMQALLNGDAETAKATKRALKKIDPKLNFPELDQEDHFAAQVDAVRKENETLRNELKEKEFKTATEAEHARIRNRGYKVEDVQKLMTERGIVKFDTAMDVLDMEGRLATPTPDSATMYDMPGAKGTAEADFWKNPQKAARKMAHNIIDQHLKRRA